MYKYIYIYGTLENSGVGVRLLLTCTCQLPCCPTISFPRGAGPGAGPLLVCVYVYHCFHAGLEESYRQDSKRKCLLASLFCLLFLPNFLHSKGMASTRQTLRHALWTHFSRRNDVPPGACSLGQTVFPSYCSRNCHRRCKAIIQNCKGNCPPLWPALLSKSPLSAPLLEIRTPRLTSLTSLTHPQLTQPHPYLSSFCSQIVPTPIDSLPALLYWRLDQSYTPSVARTHLTKIATAVGFNKLILRLP